jgi:hypothetical protein
MSRIWRWITPVAVAGGLVAVVPAIPAASASTAAASIITISATSPHYPRLPAKDHGLVDGHAIVFYKDTTKSANTAIVSGNVTTTATTDTATLLAEPFGAKTYTAVATSPTLAPSSAGVAPYSFDVKPSLATHYKVQLSGADTAVSGVVTVYVSAGGRSAGGTFKCITATKCKFSFRLYTYLPASALKHEIHKHWYQYLAVGYPRLPKNYTLSKTATVSKARKINSGEYVQTFTYYFTLRHGTANPEFQACVKDTESVDGMGLPGHHDCGNKHVSRSAIYLG